MTHYAWTIKAPGRQDIQKVTTLDELRDVLRVLDLPGIAPPEFITVDMEVSDHGTYHHDEGGGDEWSLTWTKVDDTPIADWVPHYGSNGGDYADAEKISGGFQHGDGGFQERHASRTF